jgi:hypothetical protein
MPHQYVVILAMSTRIKNRRKPGLFCSGIFLRTRNFLWLVRIGILIGLCFAQDTHANIIFGQSEFQQLTMIKSSVSPEKKDPNSKTGFPAVLAWHECSTKLMVSIDCIIPIGYYHQMRGASGQCKGCERTNSES